MTNPKTPRLTSKQLEVLRKMAEGWTLTWLTHARDNPSEHLSSPQKKHEWESVRSGTVHKFRKLGMIQMVSDPAWAWRSADYRITQKGKEYLACLKK